MIFDSKTTEQRDEERTNERTTDRILQGRGRYIPQAITLSKLNLRYYHKHIHLRFACQLEFLLINLTYLCWKFYLLSILLGVVDFFIREIKAHGFSAKGGKTIASVNYG